MLVLDTWDETPTLEIRFALRRVLLLYSHFYELSIWFFNFFNFIFVSLFFLMSNFVCAFLTSCGIHSILGIYKIFARLYPKIMPFFLKKQMIWVHTEKSTRNTPQFHQIVGTGAQFFAIYPNHLIITAYKPTLTLPTLAPTLPHTHHLACEVRHVEKHQRFPPLDRLVSKNV